MLFTDCEAAFNRTSVPRSVAVILQAAGVEFGLMGQQWCCGGPMWETGYVDVAHKMAEHNMIDWRKTGTKRIICLDPHDYITIVEYYPQIDDNFDEFEIVLGVDLIAELIRDGKLNDDADRAHGHLPRSVPPEQAPRHLAVAARSCGRSRGSCSWTSTT